MQKRNKGEPVTSCYFMRILWLFEKTSYLCPREQKDYDYDADISNIERGRNNAARAQGHWIASRCGIDNRVQDQRWLQQKNAPSTSIRKRVARKSIRRDEAGSSWRSQITECRRFHQGTGSRRIHMRVEIVLGDEFKRQFKRLANWDNAAHYIR